MSEAFERWTKKNWWIMYYIFERISLFVCNISPQGLKKRYIIIIIIIAFAAGQRTRLEEVVFVLYNLSGRLDRVAAQPQEHHQVCGPRHILPHTQRARTSDSRHLRREVTSPHG